MPFHSLAHRVGFTRTTRRQTTTPTIRKEETMWVYTLLLHFYSSIYNHS